MRDALNLGSDPTSRSLCGCCRLGDFFHRPFVRSAPGTHTGLRLFRDWRPITTKDVAGARARRRLRLSFAAYLPAFGSGIRAADCLIWSEERR
jgi:hypothetical protein